MKKIYTIALLILSGLGMLNLNAQTPLWAWADGAGDTGNEIGTSICTDASGNVYMTGTYSTLTIFGNDTLSSLGYTDIFLVKYDAAGNVIWTRNYGSPNYDGANSIGLDANGNVCITGHFGVSITFDTIILNGSPVGNSVFTAKLSSTGNVIWVKCMNTPSGNNAALDVCTDANSNVYVSGYFSSIIYFGNDTLYCFFANLDAFIAKYDSSGNELWAGCSRGNGFNYGSSLAVDASGNVYMTGSFNGAYVTFGNDTLYNASSSSFDMLLVKFDTTGNVMWTKSGGGVSQDYGYGITSANNGDIYITGTFSSGIIAFGSTLLTNSNGSSPDMYVVKYDTSGSLLWVKNGISSGFGNGATAISADAMGNAYVTGYFNGSWIAFGSLPLMTNTNPGTSDVFVVKFDVTGNAVWSISGRGTNSQQGKGICSNMSGNEIYVTGFYNNSSVIFGNDTLSNGGLYDVFIAKVDFLTAIEDHASNSASIFPNPFSLQTVLYLSSPVKNASLIISDVSGKEIKKSLFSGTGITIDREELAGGIYFFKIISESKIIKVEKVIIQ